MKIEIIRGVLCLALISSLTAVAEIPGTVMAAAPIGNLPSYTLHNGDTVVVPFGLWPYFTTNGITDINGIFPDSMVVMAAGLDKGDCVPQYIAGTFICVNYRFRCGVVIPPTPVTDAGTFYLNDLYAALLAAPGDPKGTCYATQSAASNGTPTLVLVAQMVGERSPFAVDSQASRGIIQYLSGGSAAMQVNGTTMLLSFQYNPRPGDPQTFTIGGYDPAMKIKDAFTSALGSQLYPLSVSGAIAGVGIRKAAVK